MTITDSPRRIFLWLSASSFLGSTQKATPRTPIRQLPNVRHRPLSMAHPCHQRMTGGTSACTVVRHALAANNESLTTSYKSEPTGNPIPSSCNDKFTKRRSPQTYHVRPQSPRSKDGAPNDCSDDYQASPVVDAQTAVGNGAVANRQKDISQHSANDDRRMTPTESTSNRTDSIAAPPEYIHKITASRQTHAARLEKFKARQREEAIHITRAHIKKPHKSQGSVGQSKPPLENVVQARERERWQIDKAALQEKMRGEAWNPKKKLSPDALEGIRSLHARHPEEFTTPVLAQQFKISPEAVRRILKSKWRPTSDEEEARRERWDRRGEKIWTALVDQGVHAPKKWREMGIGSGPRRAAQARPAAGSARHQLDAYKSTDVSAPPRNSSAWVRSLASRLM